MCEIMGEGTDMARFADMYARDEIAAIPEGNLDKQVRRIIDFKSSRAIEYQHIFGSKDCMRAEAAVAFIRGIWRFPREECMA